MPQVDGVTESERALKRLCDQTFLSLWSHPAIFRDQGRESPGGHGKELCDLLVVFDDHVIIFSDKACAFPVNVDVDLAWRRWFKRTVLQSAKQIRGAERWIREYPDRLYLDRACTRPFPISLPPSERIRFHRIVVAHGSIRECRKFFSGDSGSLILNSGLTREQRANSPFQVGRLDDLPGWIHVLDDVTLDLLLREIDTIADLTRYLDRKEQFLRAHRAVMAAGEEELLAIYLKHLGSDGEHDFVLPDDPTRRGLDGVWIDVGHWGAFCQNPQRLARIQADQISYSWDTLIEKFAHNIRNGTLEDPVSSDVAYHEVGLRRLAREPRMKRRFLAKKLIELVLGGPLDKPRIRIMLASRPEETCYVFLVVPPAFTPSGAYRAFRREMLQAYCMVTKLQNPVARHIVGIATEPGDEDIRSEDLVYLDASDWSENQQRAAQRLQREVGILTNVRMWQAVEKEYPDRADSGRSTKIGRNARCPCGSGLKVKRCCGR